MLSEVSLNVAVPLAEKYAQEGKTLVARPGSVLSNLVSLTTDAVNIDEYFKVNDYSQIDIDLIINDIERRTQSTVEKQTAHSICKEEYIRDISLFVQNHISYAKNEVKPVCQELFTQISHYLQNTPAKQAQDSINLIEYHLPDIAADEDFLQSIAYMKDKAILPPEKILNFPVKNNDEIFQMLLTGQKSIDELILPWATLLSSDFLSNIWNSFFTTMAQVPNGSVLDFNSIKSMGLTERLDAGLSLYLISNSLTAHVQSTKDNLSLNQYNLYLGQMKDYAAALISDCLNMFVLLEKTQTVIIGIGLDKKSVLVYEPVYNQFLEQGGNAQVILGLVVSNRELRTLSTLLAQKDDLMSSWQSYVSFFNASEINKRVEYFREALLDIVYSLVYKEKIQAIEEYRRDKSEYDESLKKMMNNYIDNLTLKQLENIDQISLEVGAKIIFYFTDSYSILNGIEQAYAANENINPREAALISAISYVAKFMADQIAVS